MQYLLLSGNPLFDIARWMVYCVDAEIRREIEEQVVNCYYDKLTELFKEEGNEGVKFTRDQVSTYSSKYPIRISGT